MKLTEKRKRILDTLQKEQSCLSARTLASRLNDIDQATVYRNLDLFVKEGVVKKFVFDGSESMYEYAQSDHHHAVCSDCEKVIHFSISDKELLRKITIDDFDIESVDLVVRGRCV